MPAENSVAVQPGRALPSQEGVDEKFSDQIAEVIGLDAVRFQLAVLWLGAAGAIVLIVILQSLFGKFGDQAQEAWGWLLPTVMPTLGMVLGALTYTAMQPKLLSAVVRRQFYAIAWWLSLGYLFVILLTLLVQPFANPDALALMHMSNLWLGPLQGLVGIAMGGLFVSSERQTRVGA